MAITILAPALPAADVEEDEYASDDGSENGGVGLGDDTEMPAAKRQRSTKDLVTPGQLITDDAQWMRFVVGLPPLPVYFYLTFRLLTPLQRPWHLHCTLEHGDSCDGGRHSPENQQAAVCAAFARAVHS
jgi:hypothetical protein